MKYILASASPRRRELLAQMGLEFEIKPSDCEEVITKTIPSEIVMELASLKAEAVADKEADSEDIIVIGADTIVVKDGKILGKPKDEEDAHGMLSGLQGDSHEVYTGVCLVKLCNGKRSSYSFYECTQVHFHPMTEAEITSYIATGEPMDKAGAYGIQGKCAIYIEKIEGDYNNVVGLPISRLYHELLTF